jgi:DHA3 family macrolide efflux protein-like MFS transporter
VTRSFSGTVWHLTAIELAFFIGMTLGGILMASWGGFRNRIHTMALSGFILGLGTSGLGLVGIFWIYLAIMWVIGFALPIFNTPSLVILQEKVEENFLGRLFGLFTMLSSSMMPLGLLVFGPMADLMPIEWMLIATGVLLSLLSLWLVKTRVLVEAGEPMDEIPTVPPE